MKKTRFQKLQDDTSEWSDGQFGKRRTAIPIVNHLKKEVLELSEALARWHNCHTIDFQKNYKRLKGEFADCLILLVDAAKHENIDTNEMLKDAFEKLEINKLRKWGEPDENGVIEHIE